MIIRLTILTLLILLLAAGSALFLGDPAAPTDQRPSATSAAKHWQDTINAHFAFDHACEECHLEEFKAHQRSGHSRTATRMELSELSTRLSGKRFNDPRRQQVYQFSAQTGQFIVSLAGEADFPVHWLLGSGTHAQTPVSIDPTTGHGVEFRWSWLAHQHNLGLTPDHDRFDDYRKHSLECFGRPLDPQQALACLNCHMTAVPPQGVAPLRDMFYPNVGCERCHGPRKEHVRLAKLGRAEQVKPMFTYDNPQVYLDQCAQCHRDESNIPADAEENSLARYQPYGLKKSRCYQQSNAMTCSTCHDPHDRTANDRRIYIEKCLQCHQTPQQVTCSVNSAGDCIQCHMPAVEWTSGIRFHDHQIRIFSRMEQE